MNYIEKENERIVYPNHDHLIYCGRNDYSDPMAPVFVYPNSSVTMAFTGTKIKVILKNKRQYHDSYIGYLLDGEQYKVQLPSGEDEVVLTLGKELKDVKHELQLFKRMDHCHEYQFMGFVIDKGGNAKQLQKQPRKLIEIYGDSISAGEVVEAVDYVGKEDPDHNGEYSNAYYSYGAITARMLHARLHNISQGGIALLDHTGYFKSPQVGMMSTYNKIRFNAELGELLEWRFEKDIPHVVVISIGQNDSYPEDYMKEDYYGDKATNWRKRYKEFILQLRGHYPQALIILTTSIVHHSPKWDRAIGSACTEIGDEKVVHFLYEKNGRGNSGHARISEAEAMAIELSRFIRKFGDDIWK